MSWADDPCAGRQWGITNIEAHEAWSTTRGEGVTVAVIDTGADFEHPDLGPNLDDTSGSNMLENTVYACPFQEVERNARTSDAIAQDHHGHGTHVAGTVAAVTDNGTGVASVAPDSTVLPVKVLDESGSGTGTDVARGICFAVDHGADVINLSLGFNPPSRSSSPVRARRPARRSTTPSRTRCPSSSLRATRASPRATSLLLTGRHSVWGRSIGTT